CNTQHPTTEIYTLSLHDALPISEARAAHRNATRCRRRAIGWRRGRRRRHRNVVFVFHIGHWGRQDRAWSLLLIRHRLFVVLMSRDRKSTRLNSSHVSISYAVFCL